MSEVELPNPEELEEIKGKAFTRHVALTTAIFAVLLAITSLGGNNAMKEMLLAQQQSSDQWAFYQAKNIREHFYRGQKLRLELVLVAANLAGHRDDRRDHHLVRLRTGDPACPRGSRSGSPLG